MYNGGKIITGLIIFVLLISAPFWLNVGQANELPDISLDTPAINQLSEKQCVESVEFMRSQHPQLWTIGVIRWYAKGRPSISVAPEKSTK